MPRSEEVLDFELTTLANFLDACQCGRGEEVNFCQYFLGGGGRVVKLQQPCGIFSVYDRCFWQIIIILPAGFIIELLLNYYY